MDQHQHRPEDDATHQARWEMTHDNNVVVVHRPVKRTHRTTRSGVRISSMHKGSLKSIIREARALHPQYADAAVDSIWYGTDASQNTVIRFDPSLTAIQGM